MAVGDQLPWQYGTLAVYLWQLVQVMCYSKCILDNQQHQYIVVALTVVRLPLVTCCDGDQPVVMETFHHAGVHFYINQLTINEDRVEFIGLITEVSTFHHCYQQLLVACNSVT